MQYEYTGNGNYIPGLGIVPILNDDDLDDRDKALLAQAIAAGVYSPITKVVQSVGQGRKAQSNAKQEIETKVESTGADTTDESQTGGG